MKRSRFTDEQMIKIVSETYTSAIEVVAKKHGISDQVIHHWRQHLLALNGSDASRIERLERENARLRKMIAERDREIDMVVARRCAVGRAAATDGERVATLVGRYEMRM
jgi:putative transposase